MEKNLNSELKNAGKSLLAYGIIAVIIILINISGAFKSGPCTPNLDVMSVLFIGPISIVLFVINLLQRISRKRATTYSTIIHLIVFIVWLIVLKSF